MERVSSKLMCCRISDYPVRSLLNWASTKLFTSYQLYTGNTCLIIVRSQTLLAAAQLWRKSFVQRVLPKGTSATVNQKGESILYFFISSKKISQWVLFRSQDHLPQSSVNHWKRKFRQRKISTVTLHSPSVTHQLILNYILNLGYKNLGWKYCCLTTRRSNPSQTEAFLCGVCLFSLRRRGVSIGYFLSQSENIQANCRLYHPDGNGVVWWWMVCVVRWWMDVMQWWRSRYIACFATFPFPLFLERLSFCWRS